VTGRYQLEDMGLLSHDSESGAISGFREYGVVYSNAKKSAYH